MSRGGKTALVVGSACIIFGGTMMLVLNERHLGYQVGCSTLIIGGVVFIVGIPAGIIGGATKRSVQNAFSEKYLGTTQPKGKGQFQLQLSGNGIGLAHVF